MVCIKMFKNINMNLNFLMQIDNLQGRASIKSLGTCFYCFYYVNYEQPAQGVCYLRFRCMLSAIREGAQNSCCGLMVYQNKQLYFYLLLAKQFLTFLLSIIV